MSETAPLHRLHYAVNCLLDELGIAAGIGPPMAYFETDVDLVSCSRWIYDTVLVGCLPESLHGPGAADQNKGVPGRFKVYEELEAATLAYLRGILKPGQPLVWRKSPETRPERGHLKAYMRFVQVPDMMTFGKALALAADPNYVQTTVSTPPFPDPPEYRMSCGPISPRDVQVAADADSGLAAKIEAGMIVARDVKDETGALVFMRVPPALVLAIIRVTQAYDPQAEAMKFTMAR